MSFTTEIKIIFLDLNKIASDKKNQNNISMKAIKIELNNLDESITTETNNSNDNNNGMNLKTIKLKSYLNQMIKITNRF